MPDSAEEQMVRAISKRHADVLAKLDPPGLPDPLRAVEDETGPRSTWDVLALSIVAAAPVASIYRCRVRWLRFCWFRRCCGHRMRVCAVDYQDKRLTFGWQRHWLKYLACGVCGRFRNPIFP